MPPTLREVGAAFDLRAPTTAAATGHRLPGTFCLEADGALEGLPAHVAGDATGTVRVSNLRAHEPGVIRVRIRDASGAFLAESNPLVVVGAGKHASWWGDFHAQSEETIGTNSAREYFEFARDRVCCTCYHQGMTFDFKSVLERTQRPVLEFNEPAASLPRGYGSPLTPRGTDIYFFDEHRPIRRSSHALVDLGYRTDCNHVRTCSTHCAEKGKTRSHSRTWAVATPTYAGRRQSDFSSTLAGTLDDLF